MKIIFDAANHQMYPIGADGFTSGTVVMVRQIAAGLAERGHSVHVITPDLRDDEQRGPTLWYWPPNVHPVKADVAVQLMHVNPNAEYDAPILLLMTFGVDPFLGPDHAWAAQVEGFPVLSETHGELLRRTRPTVEESKCFVTGLGVRLEDYTFFGGVECPGGVIDCGDCERDLTEAHKVPGRLLYANDPARGLPALLDIFEKVRERMPEASLHVAYDFDRNFQVHAWQHSYMAQMLWDCKRRMETMPGVVNLGAVDRETIIREQLECQVHCMPSSADHDQLHGLTQLECAAACCALVLSDVCAFPEVFSDGAMILPQVGKYLPEIERRCDAADWAEVVVELMRNPEKWREASEKARALAEKNTWDKVIDRWEAMLAKLRKGVTVG